MVNVRTCTFFLRFSILILLVPPPPSNLGFATECKVTKSNETFFFFSSFGMEVFIYPTNGIQFYNIWYVSFQTFCNSLLMANNPVKMKFDIPSLIIIISELFLPLKRSSSRHLICIWSLPPPSTNLLAVMWKIFSSYHAYSHLACINIWYRSVLVIKYWNEDVIMM